MATSASATKLHVEGDVAVSDRLVVGRTGVFNNTTCLVETIPGDLYSFRVWDDDLSSLLFSVDADGDVFSQCGFLCSSDARLKENVQTLDSGLDQVLALRGVSFDWKEGAKAEKGTQLGFIAQEVEKIAPELVEEDENGFKAVRYSNVTALLVEAVKSQQEMIESQDARIAALESKLDSAASTPIAKGSLAWPALGLLGFCGIAAARRRYASTD